jgi:hypothetical protein
MPINKVETALLTNYTESFNANGELVISARDGNIQLSQTLPINPPGLLMYSPLDNNFAFVPYTPYGPGYQLVSVIESFTPTAQAQGGGQI